MRMNRLIGIQALSLTKRRNRTNVLYLPAMVLFALFTFYPLVSGILMSFQNWNGYSIERAFAGLGNYLNIGRDFYFLPILFNTILFGVGCTILQQVLGMALAVILDGRVFGRNMWRAILYMPVLVSPVIMGSMYYMVLQYNGGALNDVLLLFGGQKVAWLSDTNMSLMWIVLINAIQFMGLSMILYLTGLQNISTMYIEAARVDGASAWYIFRRITFPLLFPAIVTSVTMNLIGGLKLFDIIKVLTNGGPGYATNSMSTYISLVYFSGEKAGYASALGVVLFFMILLAALAVNRGFERWERNLNG